MCSSDLADVEKLNPRLALDYQRPALTVNVESASFDGASPELEVRQVTGAFHGGSAGWRLESLRILTPESDVTLNGGVDQRATEAVLDLRVTATRFAFQKWGGVRHGLGNIAVS